MLRYISLKTAWLLLIFTAHLTTLSFAQESENITVESRFLPGSNFHVLVREPYAYISAGGVLLILDVSDPYDARQVGFLTISPLYVGFIRAQENYLYVVGGEGVNILDISDPIKPYRVGVFRNPASSLFVRGTYAYITDGRKLHVIDLSDPSEPFLVGSFDSGDISAGRNVYVQGDYAYVTYATSNGFRGMRIIQVSDPSQPTLVGQLRTPLSVDDITVRGDYAYLANRQDGLRIVDVSDPQNPRSIAIIRTDGSAESLFLSGDHAYICNPWRGLIIVDVAEPDHPYVIGPLYPIRGGCLQPFVVDEFLYIADFGGLRTVDISKPTQPRSVNFFTTEATAIDLAVRGDYAYVVSASRGLQIVELSNLDSPKPMGFYSGRNPRRVSLQGHLAYLTDFSAEGLRIINVANPSNPRLIGSFTARDFAPTNLFV